MSACRFLRVPALSCLHAFIPLMLRLRCELDFALCERRTSGLQTHTLGGGVFASRSLPHFVGGSAV